MLRGWDLCAGRAHVSAAIVALCVCVRCAGFWAVATAPQVAPKARTFEHRCRGRLAEVL